MKDPHFWASSLYGFKGSAPLVQLHHQDWSVQMTPAQARAAALSIIEAAEAAEQDGFIFEWFQKEIGVTPEQAAMLVGEFREHRKKWDRPGSGQP